MNWDDLQIFVHVAREGGLSGAARKLGLSVPTTARRMLALEAATLQSLFVRSPSGYRLTDAGEMLYRKARVMESAARPIEEWLDRRGQRSTVRISAGTATTSFLSRYFRRLWQSGDPFRIALLPTESRLDIAHREIDIGIRNRPEDSGNLACRKLQILRFAPYRRRFAGPAETLEWVSLDTTSAVHPAARWVLSRDDIEICAWASSVTAVRDLVRAGVGMAVMPCLVGDSDPGLERAGPPIEELTETQWLVLHGDDRHRSDIRCVVDRITALYKDEAALLAGERPLAGEIATDFSGQAGEPNSGWARGTADT
ncbi:MAG: LysR family transcriptional regulator [Geminicoccaceae bacterium]